MFGSLRNLLFPTFGAFAVLCFAASIWNYHSYIINSSHLFCAWTYACCDIFKLDLCFTLRLMLKFFLLA